MKFHQKIPLSRLHLHTPVTYRLLVKSESQSDSESTVIESEDIWLDSGRFRTLTGHLFLADVRAAESSIFDCLLLAHFINFFLLLPFLFAMCFTVSLRFRSTPKRRANFDVHKFQKVYSESEFLIQFKPKDWMVYISLLFSLLRRCSFVEFDGK